MPNNDSRERQITDSGRRNIDRTFCVAPMLDCTDRHDRYFLRLISKQAMMYTEMVTTGALLFGDTPRFLDFDHAEHPVALQLGGSEPDAMTRCAELAQQWGYDEVNINVGCPSDRVQSGSFGACLMQQPGLVAQNIKQMQSAVDIPVTIKSRIGIDEQEPREALWNLVDESATAGCQVFLIHARKAWLKGLSPKENRDIPPLDYELVYQLKTSFPELQIILNGGLKTLDECEKHLEYVDGVMMGREAYSNPYLLADVDRRFYGSSAIPLNRDQVLDHYIDYCDKKLQEGYRLSALSRHIVGLYHGQPNSRLWRRHLSENAHLSGAETNILVTARERLYGA